MLGSRLEWKVPWPMFSTKWLLVAAKTVKLDPGKISCTVAACVILSNNMSWLHKYMLQFSLNFHVHFMTISKLQFSQLHALFCKTVCHSSQFTLIHNLHLNLVFVCLIELRDWAFDFLLRIIDWVRSDWVPMQCQMYDFCHLPNFPAISWSVVFWYLCSVPY